MYSPPTDSIIYLFNGCQGLFMVFVCCWTNEECYAAWDICFGFGGEIPPPNEISGGNEMLGGNMFPPPKIIHNFFSLLVV